LTLEIEAKKKLVARKSFSFFVANILMTLRKFRKMSTYKLMGYANQCLI